LASRALIAASYRKPRWFAAAGVAGGSGGELGYGTDLVASTPLLPALIGVGPGLLGAGGGAGVVPGGAGKSVTLSERSQMGLDLVEAHRRLQLRSRSNAAIIMAAAVAP
jgi:hypothetical protein